MNAHSDPARRRDELLADRALFGLDDAEQRELRQLLVQSPTSGDSEVFDRLAAALDPVSRQLRLPALPEALLHRIRSAAAETLNPPRAPYGQARASESERARSRQTEMLDAGPPTSPHETMVAPAPAPSREGDREQLRRVQFRERVAWLVAAAAVLYAVLAGLPSGDDAANLAARRQQLLQSAPDLVQVTWQATDDPAARDAGGDLIWSPSSQEGYMTFRGLATNDPNAEQYQLWLVDPDRDDKYPVDGGVFDVKGNQGDVIVPIRAKLPVDQPTQFVITIEKPGGVVVSRQERAALLAVAGSP